MKSAQKPKNEKQRLEALESLNILDTLPESSFDELTYLASQICGTPIALISLVDDERQWFKSKVGLEANETHRDLAFCAHAILNDDIFIVSDATKDQRFSDNPLVTGGPRIQFYAGAPLLSPDGYPIGTVCVIDKSPRALTPQQIKSLGALSNQVTQLLDLRLQIERLKLSEEKLQFKNKALETIFDGVVLQDSTGAIVDFNHAAPKVLRLTANQLQGKTSLDPAWQSIHEDGTDFPGLEHPAMVCLRTGKPQRNIIMGIRNSGPEIRWLKINSVPLFQNAENSPSHAVTSFSDISEEVGAKKIIEKKSSELRFVLDCVPHLVSLWSKDGINLESNSAYSTSFKKSADQIKGCHIRDLLGEKLYEENAPLLKKVHAGELVTFENKIQNSDGSERHELSSYIPNFKDDQFISYLELVVDITDIKTLERDHRNLEARLVESAKLSALGEMAAGVAHEVNNPLAIIKSLSAMLVRKATEQRLDAGNLVKNLNSIELTVDRIAKIVKALRVYSRDAENDDYEESNISEIVKGTLELCQERFNYANISVKVDCEQSLGLSCRPTQISQVVMNLLNNSLDAILDLDDKWIEITGTKKNGLITLIFTDSGLGIPQDVVKKMMNPFYTTKPVGKGTGLGLSISTGIIESHGGKLQYIKGNKHTTFIITLPEKINSERLRVA